MFNNEQAYKEGWVLAECEHYFDIQRLDDPSSVPGLGYTEPKFNDDTEAWEYVIKKSLEGSFYHLTALAISR